VVSPLRPLEGPACPICGEGLDAERLKIGAKTCAKPECARERKRRRDAAAKGRHGSSTSRGENSLPEQDGLGGLLEELARAARPHPAAALSARMDGLKITVRAVAG
jgi:hypothetical protein